MIMLYLRGSHSISTFGHLTYEIVINLLFVQFYRRMRQLLHQELNNYTFIYSKNGYLVFHVSCAISDDILRVPYSKFCINKYQSWFRIQENLFWQDKFKSVLRILVLTIVLKYCWKHHLYTYSNIKNNPSSYLNIVS